MNCHTEISDQPSEYNSAYNEYMLARMAITVCGTFQPLLVLFFALSFSGVCQPVRSSPTRSKVSKQHFFSVHTQHFSKHYLHVVLCSIPQPEPLYSHLWRVCIVIFETPLLSLASSLWWSSSVMKCLQSTHHMCNAASWCNSTHHFGLHCELVALQEESVHSFLSTVISLQLLK